MPKIVISDTSCFIALDNIHELDLLEKLYSKVYTSQEVADEFGGQLPSWVSILSVQDKEKQQLLEFTIDKGEASALVLALEMAADLVILDDYKARLAAEKLGVQVTGTIGTIVKAKKRGILFSIKPVLKKLQNTNFRLSEELISAALEEAGESEIL